MIAYRYENFEDSPIEDLLLDDMITDGPSLLEIVNQMYWNINVEIDSENNPIEI